MYIHYFQSVCVRGMKGLDTKAGESPKTLSIASILKTSVARYFYLRRASEKVL